MFHCRSPCPTLSSSGAGPTSKSTQFLRLAYAVAWPNAVGRRNEECLNRALPPAIFLFPSESLWFDESVAEDINQVKWRGHAEEVRKAKNFTMFVYRVMQKECGMSVADAESWCKNHLSRRTRYFFSEHHITPLPLENLPEFIKATDPLTDIKVRLRFLMPYAVGHRSVASRALKPTRTTTRSTKSTTRSGQTRLARFPRFGRTRASPSPIP